MWRVLLPLILIASICQAEGGNNSLLDPKVAQTALIQYMQQNPDCFAGYTKYLVEDAQKLNLSEDKKIAYVGRIKVDRNKRTYSYGHWSEDTDRGTGLNFIWSGRFEIEKDGNLKVIAPSLMKEKFVSNRQQ